MEFFIQNKGVFRELITVLPAAAATTGPPLGPLLGQFGVNTPSFCKQFNEATSSFSSFTKGKIILLVVKIIIYDDKTIGFYVKKPHTTFLIKLLRKRVSNSLDLYTLNTENLIKIVQFKFGNFLLPNNCKSVKGTALSMRTVLIS